MKKTKIIIAAFIAVVCIASVSTWFAGYYYQANHPDEPAIINEPQWGQWQTPILLTNSAALIQIRQSTNTGEAQFRYVPQVK